VRGAQARGVRTARAKPEHAVVSDAILVLNAGSSSLKFALFEAGAQPAPLFRGLLEQIGVAPHLRVKGSGGEVLAEENWPPEGFDHRAATREVLRTAIELAQGRPIAAVGHRVAHGGELYAGPVRIDREVLDSLARLAPLAPLHQPHNLAPIETILEAAPRLPQVACFDTAFHRGQPPIAQLFGLPRRFTEAGVRRYGFHGLSYEYVSARLAELAPDLSQGRVIVAHLGSGASLCAIRAGRSIATTMGFSPLDGLVMGTRCGALDPGVLLHLMSVYQLGHDELEDLLYRRSGLLGVSGVSSDMRALRGSEDPAAAEAIALFVYRAVREIGSLAAALGGVDGMVFTGGIGENDAVARADIAAGCEWLGLALDAGANLRGSGRISAPASRVEGWVIPTDEEQMAARHTRAVLEPA
jgi:acetate kinase